MSTNTSEPQAPSPPEANGTRKAPRTRRTKAQMTAAKTGATAARKTPAPEPVVATRAIAPAPGTPARPAIISNVVVSTFGALSERLSELTTQRAILDGRIAEVRQMLAVAQPRAASPGKRKATGKRKARAKAKAKAPLKQAA